MTMLASFFSQLAQAWLQSAHALAPIRESDAGADGDDRSEKDDHRAFYVLMTHWL